MAKELVYKMWFTEARNSCITHMSLRVMDEDTWNESVFVHGRDVILNRSWESFLGQTALTDALWKLKASTENIREVQNQHTLVEAIEY